MNRNILHLSSSKDISMILFGSVLYKITFCFLSVSIFCFQCFVCQVAHIGSTFYNNLSSWSAGQLCEPFHPVTKVLLLFYIKIDYFLFIGQGRWAVFSTICSFASALLTPSFFFPTYWLFPSTLDSTTASLTPFTPLLKAAATLLSLLASFWSLLSLWKDGRFVFCFLLF